MGDEDVFYPGGFDAELAELDLSALPAVHQNGNPPNRNQLGGLVSVMCRCGRV
jgi:hypothetical protein